MYFPYLRGKQYELLALKELSSFLGERRNVFPVIEPVRIPEGGLTRCLGALTAEGLPYAIVVNPNVGDLSDELMPAAIARFVEDNGIPDESALALLVNETTEVTSLLSAYETAYGAARKLMLIHKGRTIDLATLRAESERLGRQFDVIDEGIRRRHYLDFSPPSSPVTLRDGFLRAERNADYLPRGEADFSDDHLYYNQEGWFGFGDYLTIGEGFVDAGFTPRAVAIHWTYEPSEGEPIKIRHFTSENNGDISNIGGKFLEAAGKLVAFLDQENVHTQASEVMRSQFAASNFPGLGIVKKLSLQNHLELVSTILGR